MSWLASALAGSSSFAARLKHTARRDGFDYQGVAPAPFDLTDPSSLDHFLAAVTRCAALGTHVADAETVDTAQRAVIKAATPATLRTQLVAGRLTTYYGSEAAVVSNTLRG